MGKSQVLVKIGARISHLCGMMTVVCGVASAQLVMTGNGGMVRLFGTDQAILETPEPRKDLPCSVTPTKTAQVGFDLKFHGGYEVTVPMKELSGQENLLTIIFRVTPAVGDATYFIQRIRVPEIDEDAKGEAAFFGSFDVGEGKYKVAWLMRDRAEGVCSNFWEVGAQLAGCRTLRREPRLRTGLRPAKCMDVPGFGYPRIQLRYALEPVRGVAARWG